VNVSNNGLRLVKAAEGFRARPYRDPVGVWTIGYGETKGIGPHTKPWSEKYASQRLAERINRDYGSHVNRLGLHLNQNQHDALASFVYNLGPGAINPDTGIGRALRTQRWQRAGDEMLKWDKADGRRLLGLTRRRKAERALFLKPYVDPELKELRARYARVKASIVKRQREGLASPGQRALLKRLRFAIAKRR
jgi:GH24 family phage-related lysozyme (muramidase)